MTDVNTGTETVEENVEETTTSPIVPLSEEETLKLLESSYANSDHARRLIDVLASYIPEFEFTKQEGFSQVIEGLEVKAVVLSNEEGTVNVTYSEAEGDGEVIGNVIVEEDGKQILKGFAFVEGVVVQNLELDINQDLLDTEANFEDVEVPEDLNREEVAAMLPCIYGHWCGPGCSGPKAPVHPIDSCCKTHDGCYGKRGYFSCYCDRQLRACLYKWVQRQNKVAIMIYKWFLKQPCNPYR